jgi:hypothetical protein
VIVFGGLALTLMLAGCRLDFADLSNWLDVRVVNDTPGTVTVVAPGYGARDSLAAGQARDDALWLNDHASIALIRVISGGSVLGCVTIHYRRGQLHATALISQATRRQCLVKPSQIG